MARARAAHARAAWLLALGVAGWVPSMARADEPPAPVATYVFVRPATPAHGQPALRAEVAARAALAGAGALPAAGPIAAVVGYTAEDVEAVRQAREKLEAGRQAYLDLRLDEAIELLTGAVADFDRAVAAVDPINRAELGDALLFLGASQVFAEKPRDAKRTFERLHVQIPSLEPDSQTFNPDVLEAYRRAAPRDRADPRGRLTVECDRPGAAVFVDLAPAGFAPVTVEGLMGGAHIVRVLRPGAAPYVEVVTLGRGGTAQVNARLVDRAATEGLGDLVEQLRGGEPPAGEGGEVVAEGQAPSGAGGDPVPTAAGDIATRLGVTALGLLEVGAGENPDEIALRLRFVSAEGRVVLFDERATGLAARGELERAVAELVSRGARAALAARAGGTEHGGDEPPPPDPPTRGSDDPALWERWWFWAAVGGVVVVGATIAIVAASSGGESEPSGGGQLVLTF